MFGKNAVNISVMDYEALAMHFLIPTDDGREACKHITVCWGLQFYQNSDVSVSPNNRSGNGLFDHK